MSAEAGRTNLPLPRVLKEGVVHVWFEPLRAPALDGGEAILDPHERRRLARFREERARATFLAAHIFMRRVLGHLLDMPAGRVPITLSERGKPSLVSRDDCDVRFSLSHSGGMAVLAAAQQREVGVDIERIRHVKRAEPIAARYLSPSTSAPS